MPDFTTSYNPPGVYVQEDSTSALVANVGVGPTVVALVGPSVGYRSATEAVTLSGIAPVTLANAGIYGPAASGPNAGTFVVSAADGTVYPASEYTVTAVAGPDGIANSEDDTYTLERTAGSDIPDGAAVYVRYRYTDAAYYSAKRLRDFDDVKDNFGLPFDLATGEIISPLALAAQIALENGAVDLVLVPTRDSGGVATRAGLSDAYNEVNAFFDVNVVVPVTEGLTGTTLAPGDTTNVANDLRAFIDASSGEGDYRVGILGYDKAVAINPATVAAAVASQRIVLAWPNRLSYYIGPLNRSIEVGGSYLAAAYAGRLATLGPSIPLTKKTIRGFAGIPSSLMSTMSTTQKNTWSAAGVAVTEVTRNGSLSVRHGTTTNPSNLSTRELSVVRARDALIALIQDTMDRASLIGTPIDDLTPANIKGVVQGVLETAKTAKIIVDYFPPKVRQQSIDPSVIEVKFEYRPANPLNYIVIAFAVNVQTGEIDTTATAA